MSIIVAAPTRRFAPTLRQQARVACAVPEWKTDAWKHRVEAEARKRLKAEIHDIGRFR